MLKKFTIFVLAIAMVSGIARISVGQEMGKEKEDFERIVKAQQKVIHHLMKQAAEPRTITGSEDFQQQESIVKDYILAEANLKAMHARYHAAKMFKPHSKEIPQILILEAIQKDHKYDRDQAVIDKLRERIETLVAENPDENSLIPELQEELDKFVDAQNSRKKQLEEAIRKGLQERLKLTVQKDLWAKEAEIEAQKALVAALKTKVDQQRESWAEEADVEAKNAHLAALQEKVDRRKEEKSVAEIASPWQKVLFDEQVNLIRLKAKLAVSLLELKETVVYSEDEINEMLDQDVTYRSLFNSLHPESVPEQLREYKDNFPKRLETLRKLALRQEIRDLERTVRISEMVIEELLKK